jgi:hypothetical protein
MDIHFKYLSPTEWDVERGDVDFHVRLENDDYFVDAFDNGLKDADAAHLTTFICDAWKSVEAYVRDFNPKTKRPESGYGDRSGHRIAE